MAKRGKKYEEALALVDRSKAYAPEEGLDLAKKTSFASFDASFDVHMRMNLDPRMADQQIRGTVVLPAGSGKTVRILVFAEGEAAKAAEEAGADYVGSDDLVQKIQEGWLEFDVAMATPQMMSKVGRLGRVLGPRGLMPNPKTNTVLAEEHLGPAIQEARQGRVEYRLDKTSNIHVSIGKSSFSAQDLMSNFTALMEAIVRAKPSGAKGLYVRRITVTSTMGPGVRLDVNSALGLKSV